MWVAQALPGLPFPDHYPIFPSRNQVGAYLNSYWQLMDLHIRFNTDVIAADFDDGTARWHVQVKPTSSGSNDTADRAKKYIAKVFVCATGVCPSDGYVIPQWKGDFYAEAATTHRCYLQCCCPGRGDYTGTVMHSRFFRNAEEFRGKKCLIVGCGNSGAEIAIDFYEHGCDTTVLCRSPIMVRHL